MSELEGEIVDQPESEIPMVEEEMTMEQAEELGRVLGEVFGNFVVDRIDDFRGALQVPTGKLSMKRYEDQKGR